MSLDGGNYLNVSSALSQTFGSLSDNHHYVMVKAFDGKGNSVTAQVNFTVDTTAPSISITSPSSGSYNNTGGVTVKWSESDTGSGIAKTEIKVDTGSWATITGTSDALTSLANGAHTVGVRATDNAGNLNNVSVTFTVDTVVPVISITSPVSATTIRRQRSRILGRLRYRLWCS